MPKITKQFLLQHYQFTSSMFFGCLFTTFSIIFPFFRWITRSATSAINALCVTIKTVFYFVHSRNNFKISTPVFESKAPVGSSQRRSFGFFAIARAIDTRCYSPPLNWFGNLFSCPPKPTLFNISMESFAFFTTSRIKSTFSFTASGGKIL